MAAETRITLTCFMIVLSFTHTSTQDSSICGFFIEIPKGEWPASGVPGPDDFPGLDWSQRPLLPAPHRPDVCMGEYTAVDQPVQLIYMEEEIQERVTIAQINYDGVDAPVVDVIGGTPILLDARVERLDGTWFLTVNGRQDYETLNSPMYFFHVVDVQRTMSVLVQLVVVNIDDNPPIIHVFNNCEMKELEEPGPSECVYEVTDADGEISTRFMSFRLDSDRGDDDIFDVVAENVPGDWFTMTMTLTTLEVLDYDMSAFHIFRITASDSLPNNHTVSVMVEVENVESRPPRWVEIWAVQQFDEKTEQVFSVRAIDGDTGINKPILYRLNNTNEYPFFYIENVDEGRGGGLFRVNSIDRDELQQEVFRLSIIAYKFDNESFFTEMPVVIIVNDVNDQIPEPLQPLYNITIREETALTLVFDEDFGFHDRDLGINAQYSVHLESVSPEGAAEAFTVAPQTGYQRQTFTMATSNHSMLDYELEEFQYIVLKFVAIEEVNPEHRGEAYIHIYLTNWNDEEPIFEESVVEVSFNETEGAGFEVGSVLASDRDIDDWLTHSLLGNAVDFLTINETTGVVTVSRDDAFDYHRQSELFVQVRVRDNLMQPYHSSTSQLVIHLLDINNTPPTLRLPRRSPEVEENVPDGFLISDEVTASDPDTTAYLQFEIDWENSYATKQGRPAPAQEYHNCVRIRTIHGADTRTAVGQLEAQEIRTNVTIDYEEFEILYLAVRVVDLHTEIGDDTDELILAITIIDMNDNAPIWDESTLVTQFRVRETAATDIVIGSVLASDIDGPLYNRIRYSILPREDTPAGLVKIDPITGQISVDQNEAIDADEPPRYHLHYTVVASDRCSEEDPADCPPDPVAWDVPGEISIEILDRNNKVPQPTFTQLTVRIYEKAAPGQEVVQLLASDLDRDEVHHTLNYQINFLVNSRLRDFFEINPETGLVSVNYTSDAVLDRDRGEPRHNMFFIIMDNFFFEGDGNRNQAEDVEVLVILLDINDNAPELPPRVGLTWSISENLSEEETLYPNITAPDIDEPNTDHTRVAYEILDLTLQDRELDVPELFQMVTIDYETGLLRTTRSLRGYWGTYDIQIRAYDHGIPQQSSNETYSLVVRPYNFHEPQFVFPPDGATVRLAREQASVNMPLYLVNGNMLDRMEATDEDGLEAGEVDLHVSGDDDALQYFSVGVDGALLISQLVLEDTRQFRVTIRATDRGTEPGPRWSETTLNVIFVSIQAEPTFPLDTATAAFVEFEAGLQEEHQLPEAVDTKNYGCSDDCRAIFYHIIGGDDGEFFAVESDTNVLSLRKELDRSSSPQHTLVIAATNSAAPPTVNPASYLTVTVNVREANPRPRFISSLYTAGISASDTINRHLFTVEARHTEDKEITYSIDWDSMRIDDSSLSSVARTAFRMQASSGDLLLNMQPSAIMEGMFEFQVVADDGEETDRVDAKVFLISSQNRVFFIFVNELDDIIENRDFIAQTLSSGFLMTCNIDDVLPASDSSGTALLDRTELRAHFIENDVPVPADRIEQMRSDIQLLRSIQNTLSTNLINLEDFVTSHTPEPATDRTELTMYILAGLSAVLAVLCVVLLLTFCFRTRALNRRLEALSTKKFGSIESNLNRAGAVMVPGTNKHALEGSNPIWNEKIKAPDFDALSDDSGDSDLIGIEDMPQFFYNYDSPRNLPADFPEPSNHVADHSNSFGFGSSSFKPNIGSNHFRGGQSNS